MEKVIDAHQRAANAFAHSRASSAETPQREQLAATISPTRAGTERWRTASIGLRISPEKNDPIPTPAWSQNETDSSQEGGLSC